MKSFFVVLLKIICLYLLWTICLYMAAYGAEWVYVAIFTSIVCVGGYLMLSVDRIKNELIKMNETKID